MIALGLERVAQLLQELQNPQNSFKSVHVAGTNGKGSCCAFITSILRAAGHRVGTFTSPHLLSVGDSIQINGEKVSAEMYRESSLKVQQVCRDHGIPATQFEMLTTTSFLVFSVASVDIAVIEVGLGGLLDATNVIPPPLVCVLTRIGLDHTEHLGNSITEIAMHKAGIIKDGCRVVIGVQTYAEATCVFLDKAAEHATAVFYPKAIEPSEGDMCTARFEGRSIQVRLGLPGNYQRENASTAVCAVEQLQDMGFKITAEHVKEGLASTRWPGRLEWKSYKSREFLLDGAHNPLGASLLSEFVSHFRSRDASKNINWIIGITKSKDAHGILSQIVHKGDAVYAVPFSQPEEMPWIECTSPDALQEIAQSYETRAFAMNSWLDAIEQCDSRPIVVCGSLYLVAQVYRDLLPR